MGAGEAEGNRRAKEKLKSSPGRMDRTRPKAAPLRAVLDTNLVLSALVFNTGVTVAFRRGWQQRLFTPLISRPTASELLRVLAYPKFRLTPEEREDLLSEYLPFCESVQIPNPPPSAPACRDPFDVPFLELAIAGGADYLVTGDRDVLGLASEFAHPIVRANEFLALVGNR